MRQLPRQLPAQRSWSLRWTRAGSASWLRRRSLISRARSGSRERAPRCTRFAADSLFVSHCVSLCVSPCVSLCDYSRSLVITADALISPTTIRFKSFTCGSPWRTLAYSQEYTQDMSSRCTSKDKGNAGATLTHGQADRCRPGEPTFACCNSFVCSFPSVAAIGRSSVTDGAHARLQDCLRLVARFFDESTCRTHVYLLGRPP